MKKSEETCEEKSPVVPAGWRVNWEAGMVRGGQFKTGLAKAEQRTP